MEVLREYISEIRHLSEIHFSKFIDFKLQTIMKHLLAEFGRKDVEVMMNRIFQSFKKRNSQLQIKVGFIEHV